MIPTTSDLPPDRIFHVAKVLISRANVVSLQGINNSEAGFSYPLLSCWTSPLRIGTEKWCGRKLNFQVHGSTIPAQAVAGRPFSLSFFLFYFIFFVCCDFNCTFQIPNYNGDLNTVEMWFKIHLISNSNLSPSWWMNSCRCRCASEQTLCERHVWKVLFDFIPCSDRQI